MQHDAHFTVTGTQSALLPMRPRSLVLAAQAGQAGWHRKRDLPRLLRRADLPAPKTVLCLLLEAEKVQNDARRICAPSYNMQRHVLLCIAIVAECRLIAGLAAAEK